MLHFVSNIQFHFHVPYWNTVYQHLSLLLERVCAVRPEQSWKPFWGEKSHIPASGFATVRKLCPEPCGTGLVREGPCVVP